MPMEQIFEFNPDKYLRFTKPLINAHQSVDDLELQNPSSHRIACKVKTNAPTQYYVRLNAGTLKGGESVTIRIEFRPHLFPSTNLNHKFQVVNFILPDGSEDVDSILLLWNNLSKERLMMSKFKVVHDMIIHPADENGNMTQNVSNLPSEKLHLSEHTAEPDEKPDFGSSPVNSTNEMDYRLDDLNFVNNIDADETLYPFEGCDMLIFIMIFLSIYGIIFYFYLFKVIRLIGVLC